MDKTFSSPGLISYLEMLLAAVRSGEVSTIGFGHRDEIRFLPTIPEAELTPTPSGDRHYEIHVRWTHQADALNKARQAYLAGGGTSEHLFDIDAREFGPRGSVMSLDDVKYDVFAEGAARVLCKEPLGVTDAERHRFRMAYLLAFERMSPKAHEDMGVIRTQEEKFATDAQCDGSRSWDVIRRA